MRDWLQGPGSARGTWPPHPQSQAIVVTRVAAEEERVRDVQPRSLRGDRQPIRTEITGSLLFS